MTQSRNQAKEWKGEFGRQYTDRNILSFDELEDLYKAKYGITRSSLNKQFLNGIDHLVSILEVGCNVGNQLNLLYEMGFKNLHGLELQNYAATLSRSRIRYADVVRGTALHLPLRSNCFDLVFTSGVLIHISPSDIASAMREIHRCSRTYIWGFEYYSEKYTEIAYRGRPNLLWKANFAELYRKLFSDLELVKDVRIEYLDNPSNIDSMFMLRKRPT